MFESRKRHHFSAIGLLVATAAQPALATAPQSADLPEAIVVTGRALDAPEGQRAYAGDELTREDARSLASGRIEDLLARAPGVQQFRRSDSRSSNPSAQGITLRGLGGNASSRTLVLLDGVPLVDPFFGYVPLSALAPERLESVRVLRGGGAGGEKKGKNGRGDQVLHGARILWRADDAPSHAPAYGALSSVLVLNRR